LELRDIKRGVDKVLDLRYGDDMLNIAMDNWHWFRLKEKPKKIREKFKGLSRPSLHFGAIAVILFVLLILSPSPSEQVFSPVFIDALRERGELFLAASPSVRESPDLIFVQKNSLMAVSPPVAVTPQVLGALSSSTDYEAVKRDIIEYTVEAEDSLSIIADKFGISQETIRWANDMQGSTIQLGQQLTILPVSGALHIVRKNDTLSEIAGWYKADIEDIMVFNDLASVERIFAGDLLIIPDGIKPTTLPHGRLAFQGALYPPTGYPYRITQGLHHYNAIDFGAPCGSPAYAAEAGRVQMVGNHSIGGNFIRIEHPNGIITYYGHLTPGGILVRQGEQVSRGQRIGLVGRTGHATGCHVHFEVRGASNPFIP
jgi:LysM repeat protein